PAAARLECDLFAVHAGTGAVRLHDFVDTAAGDDDGDVLLPGADALPVGLRVPHREHAARDPVGDHVDSAALLSGCGPEYLPEGRRPGRVVAATGRDGRLGDGGADTGRPAVAPPRLTGCPGECDDACRYT